MDIYKIKVKFELFSDDELKQTYDGIFKDFRYILDFSRGFDLKMRLKIESSFI